MKGGLVVRKMELGLEAVVIGNMESVSYIRSRTNLWQSDNSSLSSQNASSCGSTNVLGSFICVYNLTELSVGIDNKALKQDWKRKKIYWRSQAKCR